MKKLLTLFVMLWLTSIHAEIIENDPRISIQTIEPSRDVGYTVGDVISRTVILEAPSKLTLFETSIPIVGNEKKKRGKGDGIELRYVKLEKQSGINTHRYILHLSYQVFTRGVTSRPAALPPEFVKFGAKDEESFDVRIPSWNFRISPLAVYGSVLIEKDMSGFQGPLLLDIEQSQNILYALLGLFIVSSLGLLYVLGSLVWLPRMGGPFARAYRDLKKMTDSDEDLLKAMTRLHQAFNNTAGSSQFDTENFIKNKPNFAPISDEISRFFALSQTAFFGSDIAHGIEHRMLWLKQFCRRCRDCERGLK